MKKELNPIDRESLEPWSHDTSKHGSLLWVSLLVKTIREPEVHISRHASMALRIRRVSELDPGPSTAEFHH